MYYIYKIKNVLTEERKRAISISKRNQNIKATDELRKRLSDSHRRFRHTPESIEKMRVSAATRKRKSGKFIKV